MRGRIADKRVPADAEERCSSRPGSWPSSATRRTRTPAHRRAASFTRLLANIALRVLDQHFRGPWQSGGSRAPPGSAPDTGPRACRTGGSSAMRIYAERGISRLMPSPGLCRSWRWRPGQQGDWAGSIGI